MTQPEVVIQDYNFETVQRWPKEAARNQTCESRIDKFDTHPNPRTRFRLAVSTSQEKAGLIISKAAGYLIVQFVHS